MPKVSIAAINPNAPLFWFFPKPGHVDRLWTLFDLEESWRKHVEMWLQQFLYFFDLYKSLCKNWKVLKYGWLR